MHLIDTHAHLDDTAFDQDRADVIARAVQAGVQTIVAVATTADSSAACVALASQFDCVLASVGIHPNYCSQAQPHDWQRVVDLAGAARVVALGETGLDRYHEYSPLPIQQDYFDRHLRLSQGRGLGVIIHTRESGPEVLTMLRAARARGPVSGVMHSFTGPVEMAAECVELGLYISFAGMVTYKKSDDLRRVASQVPLDRLLIETDSPYLSPHPLRGKRNEPAHLVHTAACLAAQFGISADELARATTANAVQLFGR